LELFLLRHGEAGKRLPLTERDRERPLTAAGKDEMQKVGKALSDADFEFDVFATSPLKRAKDSASIVSKAFRRKVAPEEWSELSPEGSREMLYRRLANLKPDTTVLCVGHEPYLTVAIGDIISRGDGGTATLRIALKKGGLARLSVSGFNPRISGELRWLLTPRQIRKLA
jgi:phosphohistidine phosphatase